MHFQTGVTDIQTAKIIARKLYSNYAMSGHFERSSMDKMLVDTYKIMNKQIKPTTQDIAIYGNVLDFNGDGRISLQDFEALAVKFLAKPQTKSYTKNVKQRLDVAKRLFLKFDKDQNGYLSEDEIPELLKQTYKQMRIDFHPTKQDTKSWMQMADSDKDGKVTLEDYEKLILSSLERCGIRIYERD